MRANYRLGAKMTLVLAEQRWLRLSSFTAFYFAQGVPIGLIAAMAPWLSQQGVAEADIAWFFTVVALPWAFKLLAGPFMDRFTAPAMGFRRPWALAAQGGLVAAFVALAATAPAAHEMVALMAFGFLVNTFAATQDVAVDGMAIDILPEDERGRANAFMAFGQTLGVATFTAVCGFLLVRFGVGGAAVACGFTVGVIFTLVAVVRERAGEKLMPWSEGRPALVERTQGVHIYEILRDLLRVLFLPMSLLLVLVEFLARVRDGIAIVVFPVIAVQELGFTAESYAAFDAVAGLTAAVVGVAVGPLIDRRGARRYLMGALVLAAVAHAAFALLTPLWDNQAFVIALGIAAKILGQVVFVAVIALFMTLCWTKVAATQFAIYMSLANLSRTIGSALFALVAADTGYSTEFAAMAVLLAASAAVLLLFDGGKHKEQLQAVAAQGDRDGAGQGASAPGG